MIKNGVPLLALTLFSCDGVRAEGPEAFQGVIELQERILGFELGGRVEAVSVTRGDRVALGDSLALLDDEIERHTLDARRAEEGIAQAGLDLLAAGARGEEVRGTAAELRAAEANETLLRQSLSRQQVLAQKGVASSGQVDDLRAQLDRAVAQRQATAQRLSLVRRGARSQELAAAEARLAAARAAREATEARLRRHALSAPVAGSVLDVHVEPGEIVGPGAPVVTLGETRHPFADVFVPQAALGGLRVGTRARVRVDAERRTFPGKVEHVASATEFTPRYLFSERERPNLVVRVRVRIDDPTERLHPGVPAFVTFTRETQR